MTSPLRYNLPLMMLDTDEFREQMQLDEDSPQEGPVTGFNRHMKLMSPATRELVLQSRSTEIEAFALDRGYNPALVAAVAEVAMRMGRVPNLHQYGFSGDDALAVKHFISGDVLNNYTEDEGEGWESLDEAKKGVIGQSWAFGQRGSASKFKEMANAVAKREKADVSARLNKAGLKVAVESQYPIPQWLFNKLDNLASAHHGRREKTVYEDADAAEGWETLDESVSADEVLSEGAQTTWKQLKQMKLNGFPLLAYLGAKNPTVDKDQLTVTLRGKWKGRVVIKINKGTDLYDLTFGRVRKYEWKVDCKVLGIEVGNLAKTLQRYVEYGEARGKKGKVISADVDKPTSYAEFLGEDRPIPNPDSTFIHKIDGLWFAGVHLPTQHAWKKKKLYWSGNGFTANLKDAANWHDRAKAEKALDGVRKLAKRRGWLSESQTPGESLDEAKRVPSKILKLTRMLAKETGDATKVTGKNYQAVISQAMSKLEARAKNLPTDKRESMLKRLAGVKAAAKSLGLIKIAESVEAVIAEARNTIGTLHDIEGRKGLHKNSDGSGYTALTHASSKTFKSKGGALRWLKKRGYAADGSRLSEDESLAEVSPPGFSGTTKAMKDKHPDIDNPHALAWSMFKKGAKPHVKPEADPKGVKKYISPAKYEKYMSKKKAKP